MNEKAIIRGIGDGFLQLLSVVLLLDLVEVTPERNRLPVREYLFLASGFTIREEIVSFSDSQAFKFLGFHEKMSMCL